MAKQSQIKINVHTDPLECIFHILQKNKIRERTMFLVFVSFTIIIITGALVTVFIAFMKSTSNYSWFVYFTLSFSSGASLISSLLNFFVVRDRLQTIKIQRNQIATEIALFVNDVGMYGCNKNEREYRLFIRVSAIMGSDFAKKEANFGH